MDRYAKITENGLEYAPKNKDGIINYNLDVDLMVADGYKLFIPIEEYPETNRQFHIEYVENDDNITETIVYDETQKKADKREFNQLKTQKLSEASQKAKEKIENGYIEFENAKIETNAQTVGDLTATMLLMQAGGLDTYSWLSMDDVELELSVNDIATVGSLIAAYKNEVWNIKYLGFLERINNATTVEDLENIVIEY
ncbi:hypothetical protein IJI31_06520 [bacterium]|nr:hypothetical protein [bacterium]